MYLVVSVLVHLFWWGVTYYFAVCSFLYSILYYVVFHCL